MSKTHLCLFSAALMALSLLLPFRSKGPGLERERILGGDQAKEVDPPPLPTKVFSVALAPDGKTLAFGGDLGPVYLWDVKSGKAIRYLLTDKKYDDQFVNDDWTYRNWWIWSVAFSPDGKILAAGDGGGIVQFWDLIQGKEIRRLFYGGPNSPSPVFSPNG